MKPYGLLTIRFPTRRTSKHHPKENPDMALSNIFREPRREITESAIGIGILSVVIWADYKFGVWLQGAAGCKGDFCYVPWPAGMGIGVLGAGGLLMLLFLAHELGDAVCNS